MWPIVAGLGAVGLLFLFTDRDKEGGTPGTITGTGGGYTGRSAGLPMPPCSGKMTAEREKVLETALMYNRNSAELLQLAAVFDQAGLTAEAAVLRLRAWERQNPQQPTVMPYPRTELDQLRLTLCTLNQVAPVTGLSPGLTAIQKMQNSPTPDKGGVYLR